MDRLTAGVEDADDRLTALDENLAGEEVARVETADVLDAQAAFVVDVADVEADLIHVTGDHDFERLGGYGRRTPGFLCGAAAGLLRRRAGFLETNQVAHRIDAGLVPQVSRVLEDQLTNQFLSARDAGGLGQDPQELELGEDLALGHILLQLCGDP